MEPEKTVQYGFWVYFCGFTAGIRDLEWKNRGRERIELIYLRRCEKVGRRSRLRGIGERNVNPQLLASFSPCWSRSWSTRYAGTLDAPVFHKSDIRCLYLKICQWQAVPTTFSSSRKIHSYLTRTGKICLKGLTCTLVYSFWPHSLRRMGLEGTHLLHPLEALSHPP